MTTVTVENNVGSPLSIRLEYSEDYKQFDTKSNAYKAAYSFCQLRPEGKPYGFVAISASPPRDDESISVKNNVIVLDALHFLQVIMFLS